MQVLEGGPDACSSESEAEYSYHGEMWVDDTMYTPDMMGANGKPVLGRERLTTEQADALRTKGMAGGLDTVSGKG
jgi:hypothetical protein